MTRAQVGVPLEIGIDGDVGAAKGPDLDIEIDGPSGYQATLPAFGHGDGSRHFRFAPPGAGTFTYRLRALDGMVGDAMGTVEADPYEGDNPLYRHGRLRVASDHRTLRHEDGTPFLWIGDTWWMGLGTRLPWPSSFRTLTADRVAKGFSVVQLVAGPLPEFHATPEGIWHPQQANEAGWPWEPGWASLNDGFYDLADLRIAHLVDAGIVPCIVGMWGYYLSLMGQERALAHWRNLVARYAAYPVIFCLAGEVRMAPYTQHQQDGGDAERRAQSDGWSRIGAAIRRMDPYRNPITAHPIIPDARAALTDESVLDIDMLQTTHWTYTPPSPEETRRISAIAGVDPVQELGLVGAIGMVQTAYAKSPPMPVVNGEPCYEGMHGSNWEDAQRFLFWGGMLSGQAGHTYGAQGIWQMSSLREPFSHTVANWGHGVWEEAMHYEGGRQVALGGRILRSLEWWRLEPVTEPDAVRLGRLGILGGRIPGELGLYYLPALCVEERLRGVRGARLGDLGARPWQARFLDPRTAERLTPFPVQADADGRWTCPETPTREDWLLLLEAA